MHSPRDLKWLNSLSAAEAVEQLLQCCGSQQWASQMAERRPFQTIESAIETAGEIWWSLDRNDWLEAFRSHPKIGEKTPGEKRAAEPITAKARGWSDEEQAGVTTASDETIDALTTLNRAYEEKFGYIFIICATGKSSDEMLAALRERIQHDATAELPIAAAEQNRITALRLKKLLTSA